MEELPFRMCKDNRQRVMCTAKKRVLDFEWCKDKMLLAKKEEEGGKLDEEEQDFMADRLESFDSNYEE
ncbi:hypothetical protein Tco_0873334 [Tanacetum coccineum]